MPTIYTVGLQHLKLADLQELVSTLKVEGILDWRVKTDGRLNQPTLERAFPGRYKFVGDSCNESHVTDKALFALSKLHKVTLILFHEESPAARSGMRPRHEKLAMSLHTRFAVEVTHVCGDELIVAAELQRSLDQDAADPNVDHPYATTEWRAAPARVLPAPSTTPAAPLNPINSINDLSDRAMLVRLSLCMPGFQRQNKKVSKEVADKYGSDETMGKFVESLIAKEAMARLNQIESSVRQEYYRRTLPWENDGTRIASAAGYMDLVAFVRTAQTQWEPAVDDFCNDWDAHVAEAKRKRNGLFDPSQYMTRDQVRRRFEFIWRVGPVPKEGDIRCAITADELRVINEQNAALLKNTLRESMADVWQRLRKVVTDARDRLKAVEAGESKTVRDSVLTNITDLLAIVPSLNLAGDPDITRFCADIQRELTTTEPAQLREDPKAREDVINRADEILGKLSAFI